MEAIYVQIEKTKSGVKVTAWDQEFTYEESCNHVYTMKKVRKNGKKSTVPAFAKASGRETDVIPEILTANTYFWRPASSAYGRRANEKRREREIKAFMIDNVDEAKIQLSDMFSEYLQKGETISVDWLGAYFFYRKHKFHLWRVINRKSICEAREMIRERRLKGINTYRFNKLNQVEREKLLSQTFVTFKDSIDSGNCPVGTMYFYNTLPLVRKGFRLKALRADALLKIRDDAYTRRAVNTAFQRAL